MPPSRLLPLHRAKNLAELKSQYEVDVKGKKMKMLCTTSDKLYSKAIEELERGDEELSYIYFMKYLSIISVIQKSDDFKKDQTFYNSILGPKKINNALTNAEKLSESLGKRYKLMSEVEASNLEQERKEAEEEKLKLSLRTAVNKSPKSTSESVADEFDTSISSLRLFDLIKEKKKQIMIIDARPAECYANSHMKFDNCISVPLEIIKAGMSAAALEKLLPMESKQLFGQRGQMDLIILLDWTTSEKSLTPGSNLYTLKTILQRWDPRIVYHTPPLILEGGYDDWILTYPMFTTNPKASRPPANNDLDDLLGDIEYPSLNESIPEKPPYDHSIQPTINNKIANAVSRSVDLFPASPVKESRPGSRSENDVKPGVDRGSKAAAIQTYEERSRAVGQLLKARETVADSSLKIENDILNAEKEWEVLRLQKEKEAEEGMRQQLQEREEELLLNISKLEESQRSQEAENQSLRQQLDEYKKRDVDESVKLADKYRKDRELEINERIDKKEEEIKKIAKAREEIAKERKRQVDEDRRKRKLEEQRKEKQRLEQIKQEKDIGLGTYLTRLKTDSGSNSSIMKRSHSSPNIAQMMDDNDLEVKHKAPQFDRTVKPLQKPLPSELNAARQRNFNGVLGRVGRGLTGLKNLGNTCYMNSIVQCISNTFPLVTYFCEGNYREDVNHANKTHGEVVEELAAVVRALWNGQYKFISCGDLKNIVGVHKEEFRGSQQQDSHEFLFFLINWLHDDLNKKSSLKTIKITNENMSEEEKQWKEFKQTNESLILNLFYGQQKSTVSCLTCNKESSTYEPFNHLSLPLPNTSNKCSLSECMQLYLSGDRISGWNCPSCKAARDATKKFDICKLPPVLVIHLKRFYHDGWSRKKQTFVDFPLEGLNMRGCTLHSNQRYTCYDLYGVSNHYGTMEGGHYTSYCKNNTYSKWYKFDDHEVNDISPSNVKTAAAYILFYYASSNNKGYDRS